MEEVRTPVRLRVHLPEARRTDSVHSRPDPASAHHRVTDPELLWRTSEVLWDMSAAILSPTASIRLKARHTLPPSKKAQSLLDTFDRAAATASELARQRKAKWLAVRQATHRDLGRGWQCWRDMVMESKTACSMWLRMASNRRRVRAWRRWRELIEANVAVPWQLQRAAGRLVQARRAACWHTWEAFASERQRAWRLLRKGASRLVHMHIPYHAMPYTIPYHT